MESNRALDLSIVIPARNEELRLTDTVAKTKEWCERRAQSAEIVIVENASTDGTLKVAKRLSSESPIVRYVRCSTRGKGAAVSMGIQCSTGCWVAFLDADGATPTSELDKVVDNLEAGFDIVIGSRIAEPSTAVKRSQSREFLSRVLNVLIRPLIPGGVEDAMCGFKAFQRHVATRIFGVTRISGWAFDIEVLYLAKVLGMSVKTIPISWNQQPGSSVGFLFDPIKMLFDAARVPFLHRGIMSELKSNDRD